MSGGNQFANPNNNDPSTAATQPVIITPPTPTQILDEAVSREIRHGLDPSSAKTWILPRKKDLKLVNLDKKKIEAAIMKNALLSLPTGKGEYGAVLVYNFQRWFHEKTIIWATPFVKKRTEACKSLGIDPTKIASFEEDFKNDAGNNTGTSSSIGTSSSTGKSDENDERKECWKTKSIFIVSPSQLQADLNSHWIDEERVRLVIFDDPQFYCYEPNGVGANLVGRISHKNVQFRTVALSRHLPATISPQVFENLKISSVRVEKPIARTLLSYITPTNVAPFRLDDVSRQIISELKEARAQLLGWLSMTTVEYFVGAKQWTNAQVIEAKDSFQNRVESGEAGDFSMEQFTNWGGWLAACVYVNEAIDTVTTKGAMVLHKQWTDMPDADKPVGLSQIHSVNSAIRMMRRKYENITPRAFLEKSNPKLQELSNIVCKNLEIYGKMFRGIVFAKTPEMLTQITQLLTHLKVNAVKYTEQEEQGIKTRLREGSLNIIVCPSKVMEDEKWVKQGFGTFHLIVNVDLVGVSPYKCISPLIALQEETLCNKVYVFVTEEKEKDSFENNVIYKSNLRLQNNKGPKPGQSYSKHLYKGDLGNVFPDEQVPQCVEQEIQITEESVEKVDVQVRVLVTGSQPLHDSQVSKVAQQLETGGEEEQVFLTQEEEDSAASTRKRKRENEAIPGDKRVKRQETVVKRPVKQKPRDMGDDGEDKEMRAKRARQETRQEEQKEESLSSDANGSETRKKKKVRKEEQGH